MLTFNLPTVWVAQNATNLAAYILRPEKVNNFAGEVNLSVIGRDNPVGNAIEAAPECPYDAPEEDEDEKKVAGTGAANGGGGFFDSIRAS